ncbi:MAG: transglutaminase-like domain-containing protein [Planctomycetia bacterium]|nr:transglutaminase-like domain-containing protein [Planctomycetia bacterium]
MHTIKHLPVTAFVLIVVFSIVAAGCQKPTAIEPLPSAKPSAAAAGSLQPSESWLVVYIGKAKVGYQHLVRREITEDGRKLWQSENEALMKMARDGQVVELLMNANSVDDEAGAMVRCETRVNLGPTPMTTRGTVVADPKGGEKLELEVTTQGKTSRTTLPWPADAGGLKVCGFNGSEQSLERKPMQPGETRRIKEFVPIFNQVAEVTLTAKDFESTPLIDAPPQRLLRIDTETRLPGQQPMKGAVWTNEQGVPQRVRQDMLEQETFRTTREVALRESTQAPPDLIKLSLVKVAPAPKKPHEAQRMVYRVALKDGDPLQTFPVSASQAVKSLGPHEAEITVRAIRPGDGHAHGKSEAPTIADRQPNNMIQSDDAEVISLAKEVVPQETDPWRIALALERHVKSSMKQADFSQALASAAEVARSRRGDCTEYAVLLAGLLRARGIASRVAVGLVYAPSLGAFGYHMWTEAWIGDEWIPLDATLGRGGIGGGHLKLADTNFSTGSPDSFWPVSQTLGRLSVKLVDEQH